jgi:hypothetical protein
MKKIATFLIAALVFSAMAFCSPAQAQVVRDGATTLIFYNAYTSDVTVMLAVPALPCAAPCVQSDGCPTGTVANVRYVDITANAQPAPLTPFGTQASGWFVLKAGHKCQLLNVGINPVTRQVSSCFQGTIFGFGQFGNQCPDFGGSGTSFPNTNKGPNFNNPVVPVVALPNGSISFEATINLPGTVNGATTVGTKAVPTAEAFDLSCVNGANSQLTVTVTPPANGPYWTTILSTAQGGVKQFRTATNVGPNSWVDIAHKKDNNCVDPATGYARPGVYPYGCSQCNTYPDPAPPCSTGTVKQVCSAKNGLPANNGCLFNRSPLVAGVQKFGGTIQVTYQGPIAPPP